MKPTPPSNQNNRNLFSEILKLLLFNITMRNITNPPLINYNMSKLLHHIEIPTQLIINTNSPFTLNFTILSFDHSLSILSV